MSISIIDQRPTPSNAKPVANRSWLTVLSQLAKHQVDRIMERRRARRDAWLLLGFDDHMLADIGLRRCEVEYAIRYGRPRHDLGRDRD